MQRSIAISIPAYNEAGTLSRIIRESLDVLKQVSSDYEVVVIDDGSEDGTAELLQTVQAAEPKLTIVRHARNEGLGTTLKEVFERPTKEVIFFIPGDGQIPPAELKTLLPHLDEADLVLGWRKIRRDPLVRRIMAFLYNILISIILGRRVRDIDSVILIKRSAYQALHVASQSAFRHAELVLQAKRLGFRWVEIPIQHLPRVSGGSKITNHRVLWPLLRDLVRYQLS